MSNNISIGNAGEYFVAGELERHGYTVAVPMSNVKDFDILAVDRQTNNAFLIQVKTTAYRQKIWTLSPRNEELLGDNIIYFFVSLNELDIPEYHIVPSEIVAKTIKEGYKVWLDTPGKNGQKHKDNPIRKFSDINDEYKDNWECMR